MPESPFASHDQELLLKVVNNADYLTADQRSVFIATEGLVAAPQSHGEIADRLGITRQRISQIRQTAIELLLTDSDLGTPAVTSRIELQAAFDVVRANRRRTYGSGVAIRKLGRLGVAASIEDFTAVMQSHLPTAHHVENSDNAGLHRSPDHQRALRTITKAIDRAADRCEMVVAYLQEFEADRALADSTVWAVGRMLGDDARAVAAAAQIWGATRPERRADYGHAAEVLRASAVEDVITNAFVFGVDQMRAARSVELG